MFSGIVQGTASVKSVKKEKGLWHFTVDLGLMADGLRTGASVALDGVCMTVTKIDGPVAYFDAMDETLQITTLGALEAGYKLNVERSLKLGEEIGGHPLSGHIIGTGRIVRVDTPMNNRAVYIAVEPAWMGNIVPKGFIAVDGCSLTVVDVDRTQNVFSVHLIPETLRRTTLGSKHAGGRVNIELSGRERSEPDLSQSVSAVPEAVRTGRFRIAIVAGEFHKEMVHVMVEEARKTITEAGHETSAVWWVPGSYEAPLALKKLLARPDIDAGVLLGYIEKGGTMHGEVMGFAVHQSVVALQLTFDKPVGIGIIGPGATKRQAMARKCRYAAAAAHAAMCMVRKLREEAGGTHEKDGILLL